MIDLYSWNTSNGRKISIMLEELGLPYQYHPIDINAGEQFSESFLAINPNGKIPAIVDRNGPDGQPITLFESGAILLYLAEKAGSELSPNDPGKRHQVMQWLMFQMGGVGPSFGQALHFYKYAQERVDYGIQRYMREVHRLCGVMDDRLKNREYFVDHYSIADISIFPWLARWEWLDLDWKLYPNLSRWFQLVSQREAVKRGLEVLA
ncbi:glutathione S-transferase family protein [Litoribacillus peritrichatus]|uniref:Glutathione S-transferase N-terminal domain-containing protein n=1 Tax=Litoribacillus peritrichatus TaxID=718191 RepID=A0ABP7M7D4_9GAMM